MNSRLSTIDPDIEEILNAMSDPERMDLATRAVMWVANEVDLDGPVIKKRSKICIQNAYKKSLKSSMNGISSFKS